MISIIISVQNCTLEFWDRFEGSTAPFWKRHSTLYFANIGKGHFEIPKTWFNDGTMKWITDAIANTMRMLSL